MTDITTDLPQDKSFWGHPKGLGYIVFTEAWERFSFYGMQALLVLYMAGHLFKPEFAAKVLGFGAFRSAVEGVFGPLSVQALASQVFGLYVGMIYLMPVLGGLVGDRLTGRKKAVAAGAILMAIGHFMMAFEAAFLFALLLIILGCGLLKGNLAAQVGSLYARADSRRDQGYSLYCMAINIGVFVSPLVCGTLGELYGWHYGFGAAGIGMVIGTLVYLRGAKYLPDDAKRLKGEPGAKLQKGDGLAIFATLLMLLITSLYWVAQSQVWNTYAIWARDRLDRNFLGFEIPVTWFQSLDGLAVLVLTPVAIAYWKWQAKKRTEPVELVKVAMGCGVFALACGLLTIGELIAGKDKVWLLWPVLFHFICAWGYLYAGPVTLAAISRSAPAPVNAMMLGAYYLSIFVGGVASGWLGRFYEHMTPGNFWLMHGAIVAAGAVILMVFRKPLARAMRLDVAA
jgi:POT family proton-dependent oligopeptide transporter